MKRKLKMQTNERHFGVDFFCIITMLLSMLIYFPGSACSQMRVFWTDEFKGTFEPESSDPSNIAHTNVVREQIEFCKKLEYTHALYLFKGPHPSRMECIGSDNRWQWKRRNGSALRDSFYIQDFLKFYDTLRIHGIKMIPSIPNLITHSTTLVNMIPRLSAIPPVDRILYLKTSATIENNSNFEIRITNNKNKKISMYIAYNSDIAESDRPDWLLNSNNFIKVNTYLGKIDDLNSDDAKVRMAVIRNNGDTIRYDLYKTDLNGGETIRLGRNTKNDSNHNMYLILFGSYDYYPDSGKVTKDSIENNINVIGSRHTNWKNVYTLDHLEFYSDRVQYVYGDNRSDYKLLRKNQNFTDISGILSIIPFIRSSVIPDHLPPHHKPVHYNSIVKVINDDSFVGRTIFNLFDLYLSLLKACYDSLNNRIGAVDSLYPKFIHINHDEIGYNRQGFVFDNGSKTAAELMAEELKRRIDQIDEKFPGKNITVMFWGDSYVNGDCGTFYNMIGDTLDKNGNPLPDALYGKGGVLWLLKNHYKIDKRIIVCPWEYSYKDGYIAADGIPQNKFEQIKYINKIGINYVAFMGEDDGVINNKDGLFRYKRCSWQWMRAGEAFPKYNLGYGYLNYCTWDTIDAQDPGNKSGRYASILPYLEKYPYLFRSYNNWMPEYNSSLLSGLNDKKARDSIDWREGEYFTTGFVVINLGNCEYKDEGGWNSSLTKYRLNGYDNDSGMCFAFAEKRNFEFDVRVDSLSSYDHAGILIRENLKNKIKQSTYFFLYYNNNNEINIEYCDSLGNITTKNIQTGGPYLRARKYGNYLRLYFSEDGVLYNLIKSYKIKTGAVFVGLAVRDSRNSNANCRAVFSKISLKKYNSLIPIVKTILN